MSVMYCSYCNRRVDTDFDAEHFVPDTEHCLIQVQEAAPDLLKVLKEVQIELKEIYPLRRGLKSTVDKVIKKATK